MARKKPRKKFRADVEARRRARQAAAQPPVEKIVPDKRKKPARHKGRWLETELL